MNRIKRDRSRSTAVFPDCNEPGNAWGCYAHYGQHGTCSRDWVYHKTRPSTEAEYAPLLRELEAIGYDDLKIIKRVSYGR